MLASTGGITRSADVVCGTVTAVASTTEYVFAGEGNIIKIFSKIASASQCLFQHSLLESRAIHGLVVLKANNGQHIVLGWGGNLVRALLLDLGASASSSQPTVKLLSSVSVVAPDWILSCKAQDEVSSVYPTNTYRLAAVTAHNALLALEVGVDESNQLDISLKHLSASSRVLLYAASLKWITPSRILVGAGSALGDILVWSCEQGTGTEAGQPSNLRIDTHYEYSAHDGSVFGLDLTSIDGKGGLFQGVLILASVSDDRTVRLWDISRALVPLGRELTDRALSTESSGKSTPPAAHLILKSWAHSSRIWRVNFLDTSSSGGEKQLLTFGEDSTCQLWTLSRNGTWHMKHEETFANHTGKNLWSHALLQGQDHVSITTGGADGAVVDVSLKRSAKGLELDSATRPQWDKDDFLAVIRSGLEVSDDKTPGDLSLASAAPKVYSFVFDNEVLMTTPGGHVLLGRSHNQTLGEADEEHAWQYLATVPSLKSYSVITGLPSFQTGFIGGSSGDVYAYCNGRLNETPLLKVPGKISNLLAQPFHHGETHSNHSSKNDIEIKLLVARIASGTATMHSIICSPQDSSKDLYEVAPSVEIQLPDDLIVTSMLYERSSSESEILFIGSRTGKVACYKMSDKPELLSYTSHHADAVTGFHWTEASANVTQESSGSIQGHLLSSGRDSSYAIHSYTFDNNNECITTPVHKAILPFGPNIEGFYFTLSPNPHLIFYGFSSKDFVVYDETLHTEIMRVECGGAHRVWAFHPAKSGDDFTGTFMWTRASVLCSFRDGKVKKQRTQSGGHGREIKAVAVRPAEAGSMSNIIATGAEDTDIRLFTLAKSSINDMPPQLRCIGILSKHNTGLQQLKWSQDGQYLFSSGGSEEFFVWRVRKVPFVTLGVVCEAALPPASELPDLRIMDFDVTQLPTEDGEKENDVVFVISMAMSDSTLRVYCYTSSTLPSWRLLHHGRYTSCCLTQVMHLSNLHTLPLGLNAFPLLTTATDGSISFWTFDLSCTKEPDSNSNNLDSHARPVYTTRLHQNAVTCSQLMLLPGSSEKEKEKEYLLITGGDDNALAFTRCSLPASSHREQDNPSATTSTLLIPRAHAAAIRSIALISSKSTSSASVLSFSVVTASNDQTLQTWNVTFDASQPDWTGFEIKRKGKRYTPVADISGIELMKRTSASAEDGGGSGDEGDGDREGDGRLVVCGVGMEVVGIAGL